MNRGPIGIQFVALVGIACLAAMPAEASAQYNCPVAIELKGDKILNGQIRDEQRPSTARLWELLNSLSFSPDNGFKGLPEEKTVGKATLKGELRVTIDGAGDVALKELNLVRNKYNAEAWVIAPADVTRILGMRKASEENPNK